MSKKYNTIWLSDIHLARPECQAQKLLEFLKSLETREGYNVKKLYLNGDIIDIINFNSKVFWTAHRTIIKKFLRMADKGVEIIYNLGNHEIPLEYEFKNAEKDDFDFNGIKFKTSDIHITQNGTKVYVVHGDIFDGFVKLNPWLYYVGDFLYGILIKINTIQNKIRRFLKIKEWSFALWAKTHAKQAIKFMSHFDELAAMEAKRHGCDIIICGHIHKIEDKFINEIRVLNSGTWVEFCSCIVEHPDGKLEALKII